MEDLEITAEEALELLDTQSEGLVSREWVVVRGSDNRDAKSCHFFYPDGRSAVGGFKGPRFQALFQTESSDCKVVGQRKHRK
jgi:hypothetical protein